MKTKGSICKNIGGTMKIIAPFYKEIIAPFSRGFCAVVLGVILVYISSVTVYLLIKGLIQFSFRIGLLG